MRPIVLVFLALAATSLAACRASSPPPAPGPASAATTPAADWCAEHGVPESQCTRCNPSLIPAFQARGDWCGEHGVPESLCTICHPELIDKLRAMAPGAAAPAPTAAAGQAPAGAEAWCFEHDLPESGCTFCNPSLIEGYKAAHDWCAGHDRPESLCALCNADVKERFDRIRPRRATAGGEPAAPAPYANLRVRLASPDTARKAGILLGRARRAAVERTVEAPARMAFDPRGAARLESPLGGTVSAVRVAAGARVAAGQPLVVLQSGEVAGLRAAWTEAEARARAAAVGLERERDLAGRRISAGKDLVAAEREAREADAARDAARARLQALGLGAGTTAPGEASAETVLRAPRAGTVTRLAAVVGAAVAPGTLLAEIHDPEALSAVVDLPEAEAAEVVAGAAARLLLADGSETRAEVESVSPEVDPLTRTVGARLRPASARGMRAGAYARARIELGPRDLVLVPRDALQDGPEGPLVFVAEDSQSYRPRAVLPGRVGENEVEILAGLDGGEPVVTRGAFLLKTEIMRGSLGAGCCDEVEP